VVILKRRRRLLVAGIPAALALLFALIRPVWVDTSGESREERSNVPHSSGITFSFGSAGVVVDVRHLVRGRIAEVIHAPAAIKSGGEVAVGAPFEGKIVELCVDEGAVVSANDVIFRLDPVEWDEKKREAALELERRKAAVAESEAEFKEAEHKLDEAKKEPSAVTEAKLKIRSSELARDRAQAELDNAEAKLARAKDMLSQGVGKKDDVDAADAERRVQTIALRIADEDLKLARETLTFREHDAADNLVSCEKAFETARTHVERSRADVVAGQVALERAERDREKCDIRTPISGVVTERNVNDGSLVGRGDGRLPETTHYIISDMAHLLAYADVEEGDVAKVKEGQTAWVRVNALGDEVRLAGKVLDVANRAQQKQNEDTKSFRVRILITQKDDRLRPDMSANVDVETRVTGEDALSIPLQAVLQRTRKDLPPGLVAGISTGSPPSTTPAPAASATPRELGARNEDRIDIVFAVVADGTVSPRVVTLGPSDGENVAVTSGLDGREAVVTGPYKVLDGLKAGDHVVAVSKDPPDTASIASASSASNVSKP
jgi:HlyD family secretion protein